MMRSILFLTVTITLASALPASAEIVTSVSREGLRQATAVRVESFGKPLPILIPNVPGLRALQRGIEAYERARELGDGWKVKISPNGLKLNKKF